MISLKDFSELVEVLYATPLNGGQWERFLDLLCAHTGSCTTLLICANNRAGLSIQACGGKPLDMSVVETYAREYAAEDPFRIPMLRAGRTGVVPCEELVPTEAMLESKMFRYLNQPLGYRYPGLMILTCSLRRLEVVSLWRTPEQGPMTTDGTQLLEMLVPHVRSALDLHDTLGTAYQRTQSAEAMADASPTPTFVLEADGQVRHCNAAAKEMLQSGDGLQERDGYLRATYASEREGLRNLLRNASVEALIRPSNSPGRAMSLARGGGKRPLQLLASPIVKSAGAEVEDGLVLLLVTDPERPLRLSHEILRDHHGVTRAEAEVAAGLLTGYSLEEIAILRRVSVGTIRYQVKGLLQKTGTNSQTQLVRLMTSLPQMQGT